MKKLVLSLLGVGCLYTGQAQEPEKKSLSMVHKITATWCYPCGSWGWTLGNQIMGDAGDKALYIGLFASPDAGEFRNTEFYNQTAATLARQFTLIGYPDFGANGITYTKPNFNGSTINTAKIREDVKALVDSFAATEPLASAASELLVDADDVTVNANVKFWSEAEGEYYLAAYLVEEGAMNLQNGQGKVDVPHHGVLRTSLSSTAWGEKIAEGTVAADATFSKTFTFKVSDEKWDRSKFKVYNVIWRKEGNKYVFINVSENAQSTFTSIRQLTNVNSLLVYPNPAKDQLFIDIDATEKSPVTFNITNILGQQVLPALPAMVNAGNNKHSIAIPGLVAGIYILNVHTSKGSLQQKFVVK